MIVNDILMLCMLGLLPALWASERFKASAFFIGLTLAHRVFFDTLPGELFYLSSSLTSLMIVQCVAFFCSPSRFGLTLMNCCLASMILNFVGLVTLMSGLPNHPRGHLLTAFYVTVLVCIYRKSGGDHGRIMDAVRSRADATPGN